ncbi:MAG: hypothetical protein RIC95_08900 [Vicingaceae bacterium]
MKKLNIIAAMMISALMFVGCEKDDDRISSESSADGSVVIKSKTSSQKSTTYSESDLIDYVEDMSEETAIEIEEVSSNAYSIAAVSFEDDNINNPSDPDLIFIFPDEIKEAVEYAIELAKATGCAKMDVGYGFIAVNGCD